MQVTVETKSKTIMRKIFLTTIVMSVVAFAFGQNVDFKAANFKNDKEGFKKATEAIKKGDELFEAGNALVFEVKSPGMNYGLALKEYQKAYDFNPDNGLLNFKMGVCHIYSSNRHKAINYIYEAHKLDPECDEFMDYYYGMALQLDEKFDEAIKAFKRFKDNYKKSDEFGKFVSRHRNECIAAKKHYAEPIRAWVDNVPELNSEYNDHGPSISVDGAEMIMTSDRPNGHNPDALGEYDDDIYVTTLRDGKWQELVPIESVNSTTDDVSNNISYDGTKMLLHSVESDKTDIYESTLKGATWSKPTKFPFQISSPKANEVYAAYSLSLIHI